MLTARLRRSPLAITLALIAALSMHIAWLAPIARACEDCWSLPEYYTALDIRPSNWITTGQYQPGDWVWINTINVNGRMHDVQWYVMEAGDPNWWNQPDPCCSAGPWFITEQGGLYLVW